MAGRVCIVTGSHLWRNPRVVKEADALAAAGFEVTVIGPVIDANDQARDVELLAGRAWERIAAPDLLSAGPMERLRIRAFRRLSLELVRRLGVQTAGALGYGAEKTVKAALACPADIYSCHIEVGLLAFDRLSRQGRLCSVDFEDWYSRDLSDSARKERPIRLLAALEKEALESAAFTTTTSAALSDALHKANGGKKPLVVFNAFPRDGGASAAPSMRADKPKAPTLHWYSQTVGPNRGLETVVEALALVRAPVELHLRGDCSESYKEHLLAQAPPGVRGRIVFHPTTSPADLPGRIAEHDIGLALERTSPPSRDLTITNKVFQFLQAGCAVIASDTSGQREAAALFPDAITLTGGAPGEMASAIDSLVSDPARLARARTAARVAGDGAASWEHVSEMLVKAFADALAGGADL